MKDRDIFVIGDTHFNHKNVITFRDNDDLLIRDFASIKEHDECICDNWCSVVRPQDIVYLLGDVGFALGNKEGYMDRLLKSLPGKRRLILGNHDNVKSPVIYDNFQKISMWRMFPEYDCVLTHVPIHLGDCEFMKYSKNIHGHIHQNQSPTENHICVSVEQINYTPQPIQSVLGVEKAV